MKKSVLFVSTLASAFMSLTAFAGGEDFYCRFDGKDGKAYIHATIFSDETAGTITVISKKKNLVAKGKVERRGHQYQFSFKDKTILFDAKSRTVSGDKLKHIGKVDGDCDSKYEQEFGGQSLGPDGYGDGDDIFENAGEPS